MPEAIGFAKIGWIRLAVELDYNMKQGNQWSLRHRVWIRFDPNQQKETEVRSRVSPGRKSWRGVLPSHDQIRHVYEKLYTWVRCACVYEHDDGVKWDEVRGGGVKNFFHSQWKQGTWSIHKVYQTWQSENFGGLFTEALRTFVTAHKQVCANQQIGRVTDLCCTWSYHNMAREQASFITLHHAILHQDRQ